MATKIVTKSGSGAPTASDLVAGELAVDLTNKRLYTEDSGGTVLEVGSNPYNFTANHDGSAKLATTATGIDVTGAVTAGGLTVDGTTSVTQSSNAATALTSFTNSNAGTSSRTSISFTSDTGSSVVGTVSSTWNIDALNANETFLYGSHGVSLFAPASQNIRFLAGSSEKVRIDASGNVDLYQGSNLTWRFAAGSTIRGSMSIDSADNITFSNTSSNTERMRIDASGNLLVGKTTSSFATAGTTILPSGNVTFTRSGAGVIDVNRLSSDGSLINLYKDGAPVGGIGVANGDNLYIATDDTNDVGLKFNGDGNRITPCDASGADRGSAIDLGEAGGGLFKDLYLSGGMKLSRAVTSETEIESYNNTDSGGAKYKISFKQNGTQVGVIEVGTSTTGYLTSSDYRLKENVAPLTSATERLKQLNPSRFNFIADADKTVDGFLAHEVQDVVPEAISGTKDAMRDEEYEVTPAVLDDDGNVVTEAVMGTRSVPDYQGIDQSKLVPLLVATIQELEARIAALES